MTRRLTYTLIITLLITAACGESRTSPDQGSSTYRVVATTSLFADLARLALGTAVEIDSIVPAGIDVHTYEPSPSDASTITNADLILMNGLGLDEWVGSLVEATKIDPSDVIHLGEGLDTSYSWTYLMSEEPDAEHGTDPHIWLDPNGAALYLQKIANRVMLDRPNLTLEIQRSLASGLASLQQLDAEVRALYEAIPKEDRKIVTFHDAFGYYARAYDITIVGVAVSSPGQDPSAKEIASLIDAIREAKVTTVFSEVQFPSKILASIAAETGATVLADLYSDALGAAPNDSYLGAMRSNATSIAASMQR